MYHRCLDTLLNLRIRTSFVAILFMLAVIARLERIKRTKELYWPITVIIIALGSFAYNNQVESPPGKHIKVLAGARRWPFGGYLLVTVGAL